MSKYVVGIDLGTSNTALSYVDSEANTDDPNAPIQVIDQAIKQVVSAGNVEARPTLPSAIYLAAGNELAEGALNLPWRSESHIAIGQFARSQGAKVPTRYVHSAKSWFCHNGIDPESKLLPPNTPEQDIKIAPTRAAELLLTHLKESWNEDVAHGDPSLALTEQEITLCVPASFDPRARNLTVAAAEKMGFKHLHLLEEPQAAIYSWISAMGKDWRKKVTKGDLILVVDVGGGTSDFSLIAVTEEEGELQLRRIAVGEHILLGGDNMDLAIAYGVAQKLKQESNKKLDAWQMTGLVQQCRAAKEAMLSDQSIETYPLTILGRGSSVIGGSIKTELVRQNIDDILLSGFFPYCEPTEVPKEARRGGFKESGLPFAADAAITRHLAKFLSQHASLLEEIMPERQPEHGKPIIPTTVLFNGGVFKAQALRDTVMMQVASWAEEAGQEEPTELESNSLDLAVAHGAAYLGMARHGKGIRIRGGSAKSYYIGIESAEPAVPGFEPPMKAMCVVPYGMEEGSTHDISGQDIDLCVYTGEPGMFQFLSSTSRQNDDLGELMDVEDDEFEHHTPVETTLGGTAGQVAEIDLRSHFTDIGVLELHCVNRKTQESYKLELNVREHD